MSANNTILCYNHNEKGQYNMKRIMKLKLLKNNISEKEYEKITCVDKDNSLTFSLEDVVTKLNSETFIRESKEFKFELDIQNKKALYILKENNLIFNIEVIDVSYQRNKDKINFTYLINTDDDPFTLEIYLEKGENNE